MVSLARPRVRRLLPRHRARGPAYALLKNSHSSSPSPMPPSTVWEIGEPVDLGVQRVLEHPDDFDRDSYDDVFFKDHGARILYERFHEGVNEPDDETNPKLGIGDMPRTPGSAHS